MLKRLKNTGTILAIASSAILIATSFGMKVDNENIMTIVKSVCAIGIALGVLNDPTTPGAQIK